MNVKHGHISDSAIEADEKPVLDEDWFEEADAYQGPKLVRRGRPKAESRKVPVSLRLDPEVVSWFKHTGPGWQTRINDVLKEAAGV